MLSSGGGSPSTQAPPPPVPVIATSDVRTDYVVSQMMLVSWSMAAPVQPVTTGRSLAVLPVGYGNSQRALGSLPALPFRQDNGSIS
jgi:hypothetical protein